MVDGFTLDGLLKWVANFGLGGVVLIMWYFDQKAIRKILDEYQKDMAKQREMYENNVQLVKRYISLAEDARERNSELKDIVLLNTQALTKLVAAIETNQYCPLIRLKKEARGVQYE